MFSREGCVLDYAPRKAVLVERLHEAVGVELLYVIYAYALPGAGDEHHRADHRGNARRVSDCLRARLGECLRVVAYVVDVPCEGLSVFFPAHDVADDGLAAVRGPREAGSGSRLFRNLTGTTLHPS